MTERRDAIVVGGGLAGLVCAWRLARAGWRPVVLEAGSAPGGRAGAAPAPGGPEPVAHRVTAADRELLALVEALGLGGTLAPPRYFVRAQVTPRGPRIVSPLERWDVMRIPGVRPHHAWRLYRLPRLVRRFGQGLDPAHPERATRLDDRSVADFVRLYFGRSVLDHWVEPALAEAAPADPEETSRVAFLLRYVAEHWLDAGLLRGPVALLVGALADSVEVRTGHRVEEVARERGGWRVRVRRDGGEDGLEADHVVLALPAPEALRVAGPALTWAERAHLGAVGYDAAVAAVGALASQAVSMAVRVRVPAASGSALASVMLEPAAFEGGGAEACARVRMVARDGWSRERLGAADDALAKELTAELARVLPALSRHLGEVRVARYAQARPRFTVGAYRALARLRRVEEDRWRAGRRLAHAGDHCVAPSLEGAVVSGLRAAGRVLGRDALLARG